MVPVSLDCYVVMHVQHHLDHSFDVKIIIQQANNSYQNKFNAISILHLILLPDN